MTNPWIPAAQRQAQRELETALTEAARTADKHESRRSIVSRVFNAHPTLMQTLMKPWALERMAGILKRLESREADANQLTIPGIKLPPMVKLSKPDPESKQPQKPARLALVDLTLAQLIQYRKELQQSLKRRQDGRIAEVDKAIAFMKKYAPRSKKATVKEVLEKMGQKRLFEDNQTTLN